MMYFYMLTPDNNFSIQANTKPYSYLYLRFSVFHDPRIPSNKLSHVQGSTQSDAQFQIFCGFCLLQSNLVFVVFYLHFLSLAFITCIFDWQRQFCA